MISHFWRDPMWASQHSHPGLGGIDGETEYGLVDDVTKIKNPHPLAGQGFLWSCRFRDPGYFTWIGVQVGSTQPFQVFFVSFAFLMVLSSSQCFVTYLYSFIKGKQVGSTQIPPTLYALCPASFTVLFPVNGSWIILCPSLIYIQAVLITDMVRLWFSSAASPDHHVQDALLWVELNSF